MEYMGFQLQLPGRPKKTAVVDAAHKVLAIFFWNPFDTS